MCSISETKTVPSAATAMDFGCAAVPTDAGLSKKRRNRNLLDKIARKNQFELTNNSCRHLRFLALDHRTLSSIPFLQLEKRRAP